MTDRKKLVKTDSSKLFTFDSENSGLTEVPSVSSLLAQPLYKNTLRSSKKRKKEGTTKSLFIQRPEQDEPTLTDTQKFPSNITPSVQRAKSRTPSSQPKLSIWKASELAQNPDPIAKAVQILLRNKISEILFLALQPPVAPSTLPHFYASAALPSESRLELWNGLKWDPAILPEVWNEFVRNGMVEFQPPGTVTNLSSARNVMRSAFGLSKKHTLSLLRVGPVSSARGVLAIISETPIKDLLPEVITYLAMPIKTPAAA